MIMAIAFASCIFAIGCNKGGGDPKAVLISFFEAMGKKDIDGAKKYATKESAAMLDFAKMGMMNKEVNQKDDDFNKDNMEFGEAKIDGDKATVPVKDKKSGQATNFTLKKEDGAWKVAFDKSSIMEMAGDKMKESGMDMNKGMEDLKNMTDSMGNMKIPTEEDTKMMTDSSN